MGAASATPGAGRRGRSDWIRRPASAGAPGRTWPAANRRSERREIPPGPETASELLSRLSAVSRCAPTIGPSNDDERSRPARGLRPEAPAPCGLGQLGSPPGGTILLLRGPGGLLSDGPCPTPGRCGQRPPPVPRTMKFEGCGSSGFDAACRGGGATCAGASVSLAGPPPGRLEGPLRPTASQKNEEISRVSRPIHHTPHQAADGTSGPDRTPRKAFPPRLGRLRSPAAPVVAPSSRPRAPGPAPSSRHGPDQGRFGGPGRADVSIGRSHPFRGRTRGPLAPPRPGPVPDAAWCAGSEGPR